MFDSVHCGEVIVTIETYLQKEHQWQKYLHSLINPVV